MDCERAYIVVKISGNFFRSFLALRYTTALPAASLLFYELWSLTRVLRFHFLSQKKKICSHCVELSYQNSVIFLTLCHVSCNRDSKKIIYWIGSILFHLQNFVHSKVKTSMLHFECAFPEHYRIMAKVVSFRAIHVSFLLNTVLIRSTTS